MEIEYRTEDGHTYTQTIEADENGQLRDFWKDNSTKYQQGLIISSSEAEQLKQKQIHLTDLESRTTSEPIGKKILLVTEGQAKITSRIVSVEEIIPKEE